MLPAHTVVVAAVLVLQVLLVNASAARSKSSVVAVPINWAQIPLLDRFLEMSKNVLLENVTVLALDEQTLKHCMTKSIAVEFNPDLVAASGDLLFGSPEFMRLGVLKFAWLLELLLRGYEVVITDVDIHMVKNPFDCNSQISSCIGSSVDFEITPNQERPAKNAELNIGFMRFVPSPLSLDLVRDVLAELQRDSSKWDQEVFSAFAWKRSCGVYTDDDQALSFQEWADAFPCDGLRFRILPLFNFPYGGSPRLHQYGIISPKVYADANALPTLVHCTGRTSAVHKTACLDKVRSIYRSLEYLKKYVRTVECMTACRSRGTHGCAALCQK
jgi:hypothetical protein